MGSLFVRYGLCLSFFTIISISDLHGRAFAAAAPPGYPAHYSDTLRKAEAEGAVVIYGNTENIAVTPVLEDFRKAFPGIRVDYIEIRSADLYSRVSSEVAANALKADVIWSSAMDLNVQMAADGFAAVYKSPEQDSLPAWASWQDRIYGVTFEPMVFVYNSRIIRDEEMPQTRLELAHFLENNRDRLKGKVATYDPPRVGLGFLAVSQDAKISDDLWKLVRAFGTVNANFYVSTGTMLEKISAGEHAIAYNIVGPYAYLRSARDPNVKIVFPKDYTLVVTRSALVAEKAPHPNAARVFLDYLLSRRGQDVIANKAHLFAIRSDVDGSATAARLTADHGNTLKPIAINETLLEELEPMRRLPFFRKWRQVLESGR